MKMLSKSYRKRTYKISQAGMLSIQRWRTKNEVKELGRGWLEKVYFTIELL